MRKYTNISQRSNGLACVVMRCILFCWIVLNGSLVIRNKLFGCSSTISMVCVRIFGRCICYCSMIHKYRQAWFQIHVTLACPPGFTWASHYKWWKSILRGVMYPGQVLRPAVYSGTLGTNRTGPTLFACVIVHEGFPWIKCCRVQTQESQRTPSWCSMSVMGDEAIHTLFLPWCDEGHTGSNSCCPSLGHMFENVLAWGEEEMVKICI